MYQGFYTLTSGMLTQNRNLNVISNNLANVSTTGYKADKMLSSTFQEEIWSRFGNREKNNPTEIGDVALIRAAQENFTDFSQGGFNETESSLDFALTEDGFFEIQTPDGEQVYTRNGSFILDDEGYLTAPNVGRVMGQNGPIQLPSDDIVVNARGEIFFQEQYMDRLGVVAFPDNNQLQKWGEGVFINAAGDAGQNAANGILQRRLEESNVEPIQEVTAMMRSQRAIQSSAQVLKMYDLIMSKSAEIGRV